VNLPDNLFPIKNTWYKGVIMFSNSCPFSKLVRFPKHIVKYDLKTYNPAFYIYGSNPLGLCVGKSGCLNYIYNPQNNIIEIIGSDFQNVVFDIAISKT
jgi:hypothetical protein